MERKGKPLLISGWFDQRVRLVSGKSLKVLGVFEEHRDSVTAVALKEVEEGIIVISGSEDGYLSFNKVII